MPITDPTVVPPAWEQIDFEELSGVLMLIGAPDTGKSTFARFLYQRLTAAGRLPAYLDGDPGQSSLGPPATITIDLAAGNTIPPSGFRRRWFIGAVSPVRHMLPLLTGVARLTWAVRQAGTGAVIYDTTGLIDRQRGGCNLKWAKIDLLRPSVIFAFQRTDELHSLLAPLRRRRLRLVELSPSPAVKRRDTLRRRQHRASMFRANFVGARDLETSWPPALAVYPAAAALQPGRLLALEDADGFTAALGIVRESRRGRLILHTPAASLEQMESLRVGDLLVDPDTYVDRAL
jgi:polynucleotide 5'-hydroxyl-kinase GRC3/NOL9